MDDIEKTLHNLGEYWCQSEFTIVKAFSVLSSQCRHRKAYHYRTDLNGKKYLGWQCTKKKNPFDWGCCPTSCPYIGVKAPISQIWGEAEQKPEVNDRESVTTDQKTSN